VRVNSYSNDLGGSPVEWRCRRCGCEGKMLVPGGKRGWGAWARRIWNCPGGHFMPNSAAGTWRVKGK
jgi:hypothetical protein